MNSIATELIQRVLWEYENPRLHVKTSKSGLHTDTYLNTDLISLDPNFTKRIVDEVFIPYLTKNNIKPDRLFTYEPYGVAITQQLSQRLPTQFGYVDLETRTANCTFEPGESVLVVADDIYSGSSVEKTISFVEERGAKVLPRILSIGNFSGVKTLAGREIISALNKPGNLYAPENCPMCKEGSKAVLPRPNWRELLGL